MPVGGFVWYILLRTRHRRYRGPGTSLSLWSGGEVVVARCTVVGVPPALCRLVEVVVAVADAVIC